MNLYSAFIKHITDKKLFEKKDSLLLAVSGGVDSMVLCQLCVEAGFKIMIAHANFGLRGEESNRDETFVREWAERAGIEFLTRRFDTEGYAKENKVSIQVAARDLRYAWFKEIMDARDEKLLLLTAHHADDQAETVLMNFCRGTGLKGLTGIPESSGNIRRPLLPFFKEELIEYGKEKGIEHVEDSSNAGSDYTRNLFRNEVIPSIGKAYPQISANLLANAQRFGEIKELYTIMAERLISKLCVKKGNEVHIPTKQLLAFHNAALVYDIISPHGFTEGQVSELLKLANSESGHFIQSPLARIIRHRHWFIIAPIADPQSTHLLVEEKDSLVAFAGGSIAIEKLKTSATQIGADLVASLDADKIQFPLLLRKWKTGDYFYPLGMRKKKKVARFFIDRKLSKTEKENTWVLEMDRNIIWLVGMRIDDRFKVGPSTKSTMQLTVKWNEVLQ